MIVILHLSAVQYETPTISHLNRVCNKTPIHKIKEIIIIKKNTVLKLSRGGIEEVRLEKDIHVTDMILTVQ